MDTAFPISRDAFPKQSNGPTLQQPNQSKSGIDRYSIPLCPGRARRRGAEAWVTLQRTLYTVSTNIFFLKRATTVQRAGALDVGHDELRHGVRSPVCKVT